MRVKEAALNKREATETQVAAINSSQDIPSLLFRIIQNQGAAAPDRDEGQEWWKEECTSLCSAIRSVGLVYIGF